nr:hypothetical protein [Tanacetum cinerariifolium]
MRTRNSYFLNNSSATIPRRRNKKRSPNVVEPELRTIIEMADNHTMEELLQEPTEGYGEAIVILEIDADHFEIKMNLLHMVQANPYHGFKKENPHTYINNFKRITSTLKFRDVPNDVIKLMMFPYSLEGNARVWFNQNQGQGNNFNRGNNFHGNQPFQVPNQGFQNQPFQVPNNPVQQGFSNEFSNYKKVNDQMMRNMQNQINSLKGEFKNEIQNTMKTRENTSKTDDRIDKIADQISTLVDIFAKKVVTPAPVKAVEESCVSCDGPHAHYNCDTTNRNQLIVCVATGTYNQVAPQNRANNYMAPPGFAPVKNNSQNRYNQGQGNNFNRGNNFHGNQPFQVPDNHAPNFPNQGFQIQPFQVPNNQVQQGVPNEFSSY